MPAPEISGSVLDEFEKIVLNHTNSHRHDQFGKILFLVVAGYICHSMFSSTLISLAIITYGIKILCTKPDLTKDVSYDEVKQLSDNARVVFDRIYRNKWNHEPVRVSNLNSIIRVTSKEHEAAMKAHRKAVSNRQAREEQERALYAKRDETGGR